MSKSALQLMLEYASLPLSKRLQPETVMTATKTKNNTIDIVSEEEKLNNNSGINWGGDLNITDPNTGYTPLMGAALTSNTYIMKILIERGASINFQDPIKGRSALIVAAKYGQLDSIELLCHYGASINIYDYEKMTPLMHATKNGHFEVVKSLIYRGVTSIDMVDENGWCALHYAAKYGYKDIIESLCDVGAIINTKDYKDGKQPIIIAGQYGRKECVKMLVDKGADVNSTSDIQNVTSLMMAAQEGHKGTVTQLIECGCKINFYDIFGWTALHFAVASGRKETTGLLITYGNANPNFQARARKTNIKFNNDDVTSMSETRSGGKNIGNYFQGGNTPLMIAAKCEQYDCMDVLLQYDAKLEIKSVIDGRTALAHAVAENKIGASVYLLDKGANINTIDINGMTPMMTATSLGYYDLMVILLNYFADINILDLHGETVLSHAKKSNNKDLFIDSLINCAPIGKANFIPWIEAELPKFDKDYKIGGPTAFMNAILYGINGLYAGLLQRPDDCDAYLVYSLVMLATACKTTIHRFPNEELSLLAKVKEIDNMLQACMKSQALFIDENIGDSLLLGKTSLKSGEFQTKNLAQALVTGPLALCVLHEFTNMLYVPSIELHLNNIFKCNFKNPGYTWFNFMGTNGEHTNMLRLRYCPSIKFIIEGIFRCITLVLVVLITANRTPNAEKDMHDFYPHDLQPYYEAGLVILTLSFIIKDFGQMEEKMQLVPASMVLDLNYLTARRFEQVTKHLYSDFWQIFDVASNILLIYYCYDKIYQSDLLHNYNIINFVQNRSGGDTGKLVLGIAAIPLTISLLRYPSMYVKSFGKFMLSIFLHTVDLIYMLIIFAFTGIGFGIFFYSIYQDTQLFSSPSNTFRMLFDMIFLNYDLEDYTNHKVGFVVAIVFIIWTVAVLFNMITARIIATDVDIQNKAGQLYILNKANTILQNSLVYESSPLCMLPAPFNLIPAALYIPHRLIIAFMRLLKSSTCCAGREQCFSLAGTLVDKLLFLFMLIPTAIYEYFALFSQRFDNKTVIKICLGPITVITHIFSLLLKLLFDPTTKLLLKSRISDGRLRMYYGDSRDNIECIGVRERPNHKKVKVNKSGNFESKVKPTGKNNMVSVKVVPTNGASPSKYEQGKGVIVDVKGVLNDKNQAIIVEGQTFATAQENKQDDGAVVQGADLEMINGGIVLKDNFLTDNADAPSVGELSDSDSIAIYSKLDKQDSASLLGDDMSVVSVMTTDSIVTAGLTTDTTRIYDKNYRKIPDSLDFPSKRFKKLYTREDQTTIFKAVLADYFVDEYTRATRDNNMKLDSLNDNLLTRLYELDKKEQMNMNELTQMLVILLKQGEQVSKFINFMENMNLDTKNGGIPMDETSGLHERPPSNGASSRGDGRWEKTVKPVNNFITDSEFKELNIGERQFEDSSSMVGTNNEIFIA